MSGIKKSAFTLLEEFLSNHPEEKLPLSHFIAALSERTFGLVLLFLSLPNVLLLSSIPGVSVLFGIPIIFISLQMMSGQQHLWLPQRFQDKEIGLNECRRLIAIGKPTIQRLEKLSKERLQILSTPLAERFVGIYCLLLGVIIALPIPMGNFLGGLCLAFVAIGILERDGLFIAIGCFLTTLLTLAIFFVAGQLLSYMGHFLF